MIYASEESRNAAVEEKQIELHRAIEQLDRKFARRLIIDEKVELVQIGEENLLRFLYVAVQSRDPPLVRQLLKQQPKLDNYLGNTILWVVAEDGDTEIATLLVRAGADLNYLRPFDRYERSFLHVLIASDNLKKHQLAILMMDYGAEIEAEDVAGNTPLEYAIAKESFELVEELIKRGALVDEFVVRQAIIHPRASQLILILVRGQFAEAETRSDKIALILTYLSYLELDESEILPSVRALIDLEIFNNEMVLFSAVLCNKIKMVELFLDNGLGTNALSVLLHMSTALKQSAITELLINRGADINYRTECEEFKHKNQYPIHTACEYRSLSNVKLLLCLGADINSTDSVGNTPFSLIDNTDLNNINREVIKHFAMLTSKSVKVNQSDMQIIRGKADLLGFYEQCLNELENMRKFKIFNHISFHTMLIQNVKLLSWLTRNCNLVKNYKKAQLKSFFPLYHADIEWKFRNSEKRKMLLIAQDKAACEILNEYLPNLAVAKIIYYLYMNNVQAFQYSPNV